MYPQVDVPLDFLFFGMEDEWRMESMHPKQNLSENHTLQARVKANWTSKWKVHNHTLSNYFWYASPFSFSYQSTLAILLGLWVVMWTRGSSSWVLRGWLVFIWTSLCKDGRDRSKLPVECSHPSQKRRDLAPIWHISYPIMSNPSTNPSPLTMNETPGSAPFSHHLVPMG